ncbi:type I-E CRISPR-associated endoribonuclease Cas2e [Lactobacillus sp. ESL0791]|uniref:type I-E CRISPR-associated endoribonuclease Cas2e n=1 Tax=Lactobacillus sp. ESL0791 TaxID=2983234 RepID=UPI0023F66C64|nr:type I-E CRISPR-associated endoribonuclease Cas2e [Lactobacillus sp. ESL0791]MDF7639253.1 type I-E CRISPR-associated endoribonuclease Cas2e [Lactobacillus sp. ESL0791]
MIVVTLTKVPPSLRGDLTKWYQEIQSGVYVGNVSARIRDLLWDRVVKNIGNGEATMVYNTNNELGYQIKTTRKRYEVVDFDGIPLMMRLNSIDESGPEKHGFSNAAKFHRAKLMVQSSKEDSSNKTKEQIVSLDIETTGLKAGKDKIISIGAVKKINDQNYDNFYRLIKIDIAVPKSITELTGITAELLKSDGVALDIALRELTDFVGSAIVIGYNLQFDVSFLMYGYKTSNLKGFDNKTLDLLPLVKKLEKFLDNYRLKTVLDFYNIKNLKPHNALSDAKATLLLANKLMENGKIKI